EDPRFAELLAAAAAAGRLSVTAGRRFACVIQFLLAVRLELVVRERHHRIGELGAPVLRDGDAAREADRREKEEDDSLHQRLPMSMAPAVPPPKSGANESEEEAGARFRRCGAKRASTTPSVPPKIESVSVPARPY